MEKFLIPFLIGIVLMEMYLYQGLKNVVSSGAVRWVYWIITVSVYSFLIFLLFTFSRTDRDTHKVNWIMSVITLFIVPKLFALLFLLTDDIIRLIQFGFQKLSQSSTENVTYPGRRNFLVKAGWVGAGVLFGLVADGIIYGKYRFQLIRRKIKIKNLPAAFKGYKIIQISDVHSGSLHEPNKIKKAIDMINAEKPDLILFTGDLVNSYADEFIPHLENFSLMKARDGKMSVLGNHDYGKYGAWDSNISMQKNFSQLLDLEKQAGFDLLRNEHRIIERSGEKLYIIGVENWGIPPFPQYGDLDKATQGIPRNAAQILMSHDPSHFDAVVKHHPNHISLTLSGHTHGMQFGVDLKNFKWSPVKYKYPKWADLYESNGRQLYVNRGFGVIGFSGRVGIWPEITVITLD